MVGAVFPHDRVHYALCRSTENVPESEAKCVGNILDTRYAPNLLDCGCHDVLRYIYTSNT